jgi:hypothetical protein
MRKPRTTRHGEYRRPLLASVHETAKGLHDAGVMDKETMRKFYHGRKIGSEYWQLSFNRPRPGATVHW